MSGREVAKGRVVPSGLLRRLGDVVVLTTQGGDRLQLALDAEGNGMGEDRADHGDHYLLAVLGSLRWAVLYEATSALLSGSPGEDVRDSGLESEVRVTDHELGAVEASFTQVVEELGPDGRTLGVPTRDAQHLHSGSWLSVVMIDSPLTRL